MPHQGPIRSVRALRHELHDKGKIEFILSTKEANKLQGSINRANQQQSFAMEIIRTVVINLLYPKVADVLSFYLINRKYIGSIEETNYTESGKIVVTFVQKKARDK